MTKPALQIVQSLARLQCTSCGAEANASCNCGKPYVPKEIAKQAIVSDPTKSNRTIAKEVGTSLTTVNKARKELGEQGCSPERKGADGKTYHVPDPTPDVTVTPRRKSARGVAPIVRGWIGFEERIYQAFEQLRMEIPNVFRDEKLNEKIVVALNGAVKRSARNEGEEESS